MSDNWVVQHLINTLDTWNDKLAEVWKLLTISPASFKGGGIWKVILTVNGAMGHTDIHITLDTYADVFARMNAGAVEMLDTKMKDIVPVLQAGMEDDQRDLKHELYSAPYKSIGAPHKI